MTDEVVDVRIPVPRTGTWLAHGNPKPVTCAVEQIARRLFVTQSAACRSLTVCRHPWDLRPVETPMVRLVPLWILVDNLWISL